MSTPLVSIIMPVFDRDQFIGEAVESIIAQTVQTWELVIVEDGGPVRAQPLVPADSRISIYRTENQGLADARNFGLSKAKGEYVAFLDDDDLFLPDKLKLQLESSLLRETGILFARWYNIFRSGPEKLAGPTSDQGLDDLLFANPFSPNCGLFRRDLLGDRPFLAGLRSVEDWGLWLRLALLYGKLPVMPEPVALMRIHDAGNLSANRKSMALNRIELFETLLANGDFRNLTADQNRLVAMHLATAYFETGEVQKAALWTKRFVFSGAFVPVKLIARKIVHAYRTRRGRRSEPGKGT